MANCFKKITYALTCFATIFTLIGCKEPTTLRLLETDDADQNAIFRGRTAKFMIEKQFGYNVEIISSDTNGVKDKFAAGEADFMMGELSGDQNPCESLGSTFKVAVRKELHNVAPDVVTFLKKMAFDDSIQVEQKARVGNSTEAVENLKLTNDKVDYVLGWPSKHHPSWDHYIIYFMSNYQDMWTFWFDKDNYGAVKSAFREQKELYKKLKFNFEE